MVAGHSPKSAGHFGGRWQSSIGRLASLDVGLRRVENKHIERNVLHQSAWLEQYTHCSRFDPSQVQEEFNMLFDPHSEESLQFRDTGVHTGSAEGKWLSGYVCSGMYNWKN